MSGRRIAYVDGASRGNPGAAAYGVRICAADGSEIDRFGGYLGRQTNNFAEYSGLIAALRWALDNGVGELEVRSDSQLMVRQMLGQYRVKSASLRPLWQEARELATRLHAFRIVHLGREHNVEADSMANQILDDHR